MIFALLLFLLVLGKTESADLMAITALNPVPTTVILGEEVVFTAVHTATSDPMNMLQLMRNGEVVAEVGTPANTMTPFMPVLVMTQEMCGDGYQVFGIIDEATGVEAALIGPMASITCTDLITETTLSAAGDMEVAYASFVTLMATFEDAGATPATAPMMAQSLRVEWLHNGTIIMANTSKYTITVDPPLPHPDPSAMIAMIVPVMSTLTIDSVIPADSGEYTARLVFTYMVGTVMIPEAMANGSMILTVTENITVSGGQGGFQTATGSGGLAGRGGTGGGVSRAEEMYADAISKYSEALDADEDNVVVLCNRCFAHLKLENFGLAAGDATHAIKLDPKCTKAYYRRGLAYISMGKWDLALTNYQAMNKLMPNSSEIESKVQFCKLARSKAFEKAIAVNEPKKLLISQMIRLDSLTIEDGYAGPSVFGVESRNGELNPDLNLESIINIIDYFKKQKNLPKKIVYTILIKVKEILLKEASLLEICMSKDEKLIICGDIHGQFYDLANIFEKNGYPSGPSHRYLFNGDFVDRGSFSVEVILTLFLFKILHPRHFYLIRGNHEANTLNTLYGFKEEVLAKYSEQCYLFFSEIFQYLPLSACINDKILVMHGGLSQQSNTTLQDIKNIKRFREPPDSGLMCDLLWSDPKASDGISTNARGVGITFGPDVTADFCERNNLDLIIRSHEMKKEGFEVAHNGKCITIFSAPNYCDYENTAACIVIMDGDAKTMQFIQFTAMPHPDVKSYILPTLF